MQQQGRCPSSGLTRCAGKLVLSVGSLVALALAGELFLQLIVPWFHPRFTRLDPALGWYHSQSVSAVQTIEGHRYRLSYNSHGYRSPEHTYDKPAGVFRVVMLGDSFLDGSEVGDEETVTALLQSELRGVEVINLGVYGYNTAQELLTLEREGLKYHPDLVILMTIPNDYPGNVVALEEFGPAPRFLLDGQSLRFEGTDAPAARTVFRATHIPVPGILYRHSNLYYMIDHYIYQRMIARKIARLLDERLQGFEASYQVELYCRLVHRIQERCASEGTGGADFIDVFAHPRRHLLENSVSMDLSVARRLEDEGIRTFDLFDDLRRAELESKGSLYYKADIHWNARGHAVVAGLLKPIIERSLREDRNPRATARGE